MRCSDPSPVMHRSNTCPQPRCIEVSDQQHGSLCLPTRLMKSERMLLLVIELCLLFIHAIRCEYCQEQWQSINCNTRLGALSLPLPLVRMASVDN
ncbi:hypothetical protein KEM48_008722 [Puccinia striiformis f. sp. tritici PST-130]|nr:hypothetical protein KEM48_008722 [Puccinia striiformis f. sp. tritici PST-130]